MITRFESFLESGFEGLFKRAFPRTLTPGDLARALFKQMLQQRLKSIKYIYVPNYYLIRLHPKDYQSFVSYRNSLIEELTEYLTKKADERQFHLMEELEIHLDYDIQIPQGQIKIFGKLQEASYLKKQKSSKHEVNIEENGEGNTLIYSLEAGAEEKIDTAPKWLLVTKEGVDKGKVFDLKEGRNLVGRQRDAEIGLLDPSVSRYHAQLEISTQHILLSDLGSTNGTLYNGEMITTTILSSGSEFQVGNTTMFLKEQNSE